MWTANAMRTVSSCASGWDLNVLLSNMPNIIIASPAFFAGRDNPEDRKLIRRPLFWIATIAQLARDDKLLTKFMIMKNGIFQIAMAIK